MKKHLPPMAAALVLGGFLVGCSHDDVSYVGVVDRKLKAYQEVFTTAYGRIDPQQTWGFTAPAAGAAAADSSATGLTRAIQPSFQFPGDAPASKFLADVPAGVEKLTGNVARANHYIDATWTGDLNIWGGATAEGNWQDRSGGTLYIKGNCDFSDRSFYFDGASELYLVEGATLTLAAVNGSGNLQQNTKIYIAEGARLIANGELKLNNGLHIYNHGTIVTEKLSTNSNSVLYNVGTVTVAGKISVENTLSVVVNDGTITAADLNTAGSGKFENNRDVTISGTTLVNSNDNTWVNNGHYHTGNFVYNAASDEVINNCFLEVDQDFNINLGDNPGNGNFKMDAGSGVVTKNFNGGGIWTGTYAGIYSTFYGGPFYIYMGAGSVFKVTETAIMSATKADYGIYGPTTGDFAVFQAKDIVAGTAGQGYEVTYGGRLAVVAETHFQQGYSGTYPYIDFKNGCSADYVYARGFASGTPAISVAATACNPGFGSLSVPIDQGTSATGHVTVVTTTEHYETRQLVEQGRVFCEDLGQISTNDLDFNDVVFDAYVYRVVPSTRTVVTEDGTVVSDDTVEGEPTYKTTIVLLAAGGTLPLSVAGDHEVHNALGGHGTTTIINTIGEGDPAYGNSHDTSDPVTLGTDFSYGSIGEIPIWVYYSSGDVLKLAAEQGWAPHKILVPIGTRWAKERVKVDDAYTAFGRYVTSAADDCWSSGFVADRLYVHPKDTYGPRSTEPVTVLTRVDGPVTTFRATSTVNSGGYEGEDVLARRGKRQND